MRWFAAIFLGVALPMVARAEFVSSKPDTVEVTIYRAGTGLTSQIADMDEVADGIAMITESRVIDIPAGVSTIKFLDVAATIVPQSAKLQSLPAQIVETNFDYSLIGPGEIIAKSIGKSVRAVRTDKKTGKATEQRAILRSGPSGVLLEIDGKIEALNCSGMSEKLVFDEIPPELADKPTLSATVRTTKAGSYRVRLSYLALGLNWSADYVARINQNGHTLNLSAWITLANKQTTTFPDAPVQVVAGNISVLTDETVPPEIEDQIVEKKCWPMAHFYSKDSKKELEASRTGGVFDAPVAVSLRANLEQVVVTAQKRAAESELGDYKLYTLPEATTVAARQIKQVLMLDQRDVPFERIYGVVIEPDDFDEDDKILKPTSILRLQNKKSNGLGKPLPAGIVSVMEPAANDSLVLIGEYKLQDLPVGLPIDIELGQANDIVARPRVVREYTRGHGAREKDVVDVEVEVANNKPVSIVVELYQRIEEAQDFKVRAESKRHMLKKGMPMWTLSLRPGERTTLRYSLEHADTLTR